MIRLLFLALIIFSSNVEAQEVNCDTLDKSKTYQALCTDGNKQDSDCRFYALVENFGDIPAHGPLISDMPFFIKTPDTDISKFVNCKLFKGYITFSNYERDLIRLGVVNSTEKVELENTYSNFYDKKGSLFIDNSIFVTTLNATELQKKVGKERIQMIANFIKENIAESSFNISDTGAAIFIDNISLKDAFLLNHQFGIQLSTWTWTNAEGQYLAFGGGR